MTQPTESMSWAWRQVFWCGGTILGCVSGLFMAAGQWLLAATIMIFAWWVGLFPGFQRSAEQAGYDAAMGAVEDEADVFVAPERCPLCRGRVTLQCYEHGVIRSP